MSESGGLYSNREDGKNVPLTVTNAKVEARIVDLVAEVTIYQSFENRVEDSFEIFYKLPLQHGLKFWLKLLNYKVTSLVKTGAAICKFKAKIGINSIETVVQEINDSETYVKNYNSLFGNEKSPEIFKVYLIYDSFLSNFFSLQ